VRRHARPLTLLALAFACGSPPAPAYVTESQRAEAARRQGDLTATAEHYERAAALADKPRDADEARYRAAEAHARAGSAERAAALYRELSGRKTNRAERADFELARVLRQQGKAAEADAQLLAAIGRHPDSGLSRRALDEHIDYLRQQAGAEAVLAYLEVEAPRLAHTELGESLAYRRARELDAAGRHLEARDAYLICAETFPYPGGAYWDDALFRAAEKELALGAPERALKHLTRLLAERESASITGSYQRGRYAEAQLKIAEIYRDVLKDDARARRELRKVWQEHPTSRLGDDALFQEALIALRTGDRTGACAALRVLVTKNEDSRYVPCAVELCPSLTADAGAPRACHEYIKRAAGLSQ
jgi:tetratricopeptide (TPR) repeat protein